MSNPNPIDHNPWNQKPNEPVYGNAYENPPQNSINTPVYNNTWGTESNKTEYNNNNMNAWDSTPQTSQSPYMNSNSVNQQPMSPTQDAYKYSGTPYGNQNIQGNAYSATPAQQPDRPITQSAGPEPWKGEVYHKPTKWRLLLRFILLLASIGHLGFAAGARPFSGQDVPFYTSACFYYLFAVAILSIIWSLYCIFFYFYRAMAKKPKMKRSLLFAIDTFMALMWGVGVIIEVAMFRCTDGSKFCSFYNVSIFWGFLAFAGYLYAMCWDIYGGCVGRRRKV